MLNGVKRKGRGAEKETEKNYEAHSVCTEAFPGVSAHQSNLITISERLRAEQIRQRVCLGSRSSFHSHAVSSPTLYLFLLRDFQLGPGHIQSSRPSTGGALHGVVLGEPLPERCLFCLMLFTAGVLEGHS